jgi:hypothetical protein
VAARVGLPLAASIHRDDIELAVDALGLGFSHLLDSIRDADEGEPSWTLITQVRLT